MLKVSVKCAQTTYLFSPKDIKFYSLAVLFNCFKVGERIWAGLIRKNVVVTFNQNNNLSLILSKVHLLLTPNHTQVWGYGL